MNHQDGQAIKTGQKKLFGLDHLRAVAISLVLLFHYQIFHHPEWIVKAGKFGWTGVDLFFVLSGYLISSQLFSMMAKGKQISFPVFFLKRFFRIIPAFLFIVALYFCVPGFHERESLSPLWRFLTFTQNFGLDLRIHGTFSHSWSLCIEEQFYLLLPLILISLVYFKKTRLGYFIFLVLFILGFLARLYSWYRFVMPLSGTDDFWVAWNEFMYYPTYNRLDGLLTGVGIAALFQFKPALKIKIESYANYIFCAGVASLIVSYFICLDEHGFMGSIFGFPAVSISYGLIVAAIISPASFLYRAYSPITTRMATLSYSIYLSHKGVIHITQQQLSKLGVAEDGNLMFCLCMLTVFFAAFLINLIIEKPFLRIREKILTKKTSAAGQTGPII
jgi:peptidoglycan/LPS O-acetylase OafA/YrhL